MEKISEQVLESRAMKHSPPEGVRYKVSTSKGLWSEDLSYIDP